MTTRHKRNHDLATKLTPALLCIEREQVLKAP